MSRTLSHPHSYHTPIDIEFETIRALRRDAVKRETTVPALIRKILGTIANEALADAVLDDANDT